MGPGISARFALYGDLFALTQTPYAFRPRDDRDRAVNGADVAQCGDNPGDCRPSFTASLTGMQNRPTTGAPLADGSPDPLSTPPYSAIDLRLSHPTYQTAWLKGVSTNGGADSATDPDYVFCAPTDQPSGALLDDNDLHMNLPAPAATSVVKVCPHDYGGVATLRATTTIGGTPVEAQIVDAQGNTVQPQPPACAGAGQFASLPIDQDCNGIADSWEEQYIPAANTVLQACGRPSITGFTGDEDIEPGAPNAGGTINCQGNFGDGLTVQDEYRGFHTYARGRMPGQWAMQWGSTDPVGKQDAFYLADWQWPDNSWFADSVDGPNAILATATPFFVWHRVQDPYAGGGGGPNQDGTRNPIQLNRSNSATTRAYVIEYTSNTATDNTTLGDAGQPMGNLGTQPVKIYPTTITAAAARLGLQVAALRDQVVAHETGHRLDLLHSVRENCCSFAPFSQRKRVDLSHFTFDNTQPSQALYMRYWYYGFTANTAPQGQPASMNPVLRTADKVASIGQAGATPLAARTLAGYDRDSNALYIVTNAALNVGCMNTIRIWNQRRALMDWTPRLTMLRPPASSPNADMRAGWGFASDDAALLCVTPDCRVRPTPLPASVCQ